MTVHYVSTTQVRWDRTPEQWIAACGVNNQRPKPCTSDPQQVTCKRCAKRL